MYLVAPAHVYVDVAGTDRSGIVLDVQTMSGLSQTSTATIMVSNARGTYKSTFSEQQIVAVSAARAPFATSSDYFTGTDGTAPNARWTVSKGGADTVDINSNKLRCIVAAAGSAYVYSSSAQTAPFTITVWVKCSAAAQDNIINVYGSKLGVGITWDLRVINAGSTFQLWTRVAGVPTVQGSGGTYAANTWFKFIIQQTSSTKVTVTVRDVYGTSLFTLADVTLDDTPTPYIYIGTQDNAATVLYDSFLMTSSATVVADQLFEGIINKINLQRVEGMGDVIILECMGYAVELERQHDDTYGRVTATYTPSYGATDDVDTLIGLLLPTGWTKTVPKTGVHDIMQFSVGTRRIDAINEVVQHTQLLGWYVLPMKHLVCTLPDMINTVDQWTDAVAGWTTVGGALSVTAALNIEATNTLRQASINGDSYSYYDTDVGPVSSTGRLIMYYGRNATDITAVSISIYTDTGGAGKGWSYNVTLLPAVAARGDMGRMDLPMPDSNGTHGWTSFGGPSVGDNIKRFYIGFTGANTSGYLYWDLVNFYARKKLTSKYTLTAITDATRENANPPNNRAVVVANIAGTPTSYYEEDPTLQTMHGVREVVSSDLNLDSEVKARMVAWAILAHEYQGENDPVTIQTVNPGNTYNVVMGDTVTVTAANINLSAALKCVLGRMDHVPYWQTTWLLSNTATKNDLAILYDLIKRKRY